MGDLSKAKAFYEETIRISEREDLRILYKNDILQSKSNALGNIGLIYSIRGDLDLALKYHQDALKIDRKIGDRQGEANQFRQHRLDLQRQRRSGQSAQVSPGCSQDRQRNRL